MTSPRSRGFALALTGVVAVGPDPLLLRYALAITNDIWLIIVAKLGITTLFTVGSVLVLNRKSLAELPAGVRSGKSHLAVASVLLALINLGFPLALMTTTAARALLLINLNPLWAAMFSRCMLKEKLPTYTLVALGCAGASVLVVFVPQMAGASLGEDAAEDAAGGVPQSLEGDLAGLATGVALALYITTNRHAAKWRPKAAMSIASAIGGLLSFVVTLPLAFQDAHDGEQLGTTFWLIIAANALVITTCNVLTLALAARYISAPEISLVILLEVLLNPLWVFLGVGERPSLWTFIGGGLVCAVLFAHEARAAVAQRAAAAEGGGGEGNDI